MELNWEKHRYLTKLDKAEVSGCSILRGMTNYGYKLDYEVMQEGIIRRFRTEEEALSFIEEGNLHV